MPQVLFKFQSIASFDIFHNVDDQPLEVSPFWTEIKACTWQSTKKIKLIDCTLNISKLHVIFQAIIAIVLWKFLIHAFDAISSFIKRGDILKFCARSGQRHHQANWQWIFEL